MLLTNVKALIVVLTIAMLVFIIAKPICLRFMAEDDFARRRNVWFALTLTAFISPSFWLYVLVAIPILAWAAGKDTNPVAIYLLVMHVIPPPGLQIPVVLINQLFELNSFRILSFAILIPAAWRLMMRATDGKRFGTLTLMDKLILAYAGLQLILFIPFESLTNTMRRGFLISIDVLVLYFVVSRTCTNRRAIVESLASLCLAAAILAPLALFESLWSWLLYPGIGAEWGVDVASAYLKRDGSLRAQVSVGHALALGYMMSIGFGSWLYLRSRAQSAFSSIAIAVWMWMGLIAAYSRGPWLVAVIIFFVYLALGRNGSSRLFKALLIAAPIAGLVLISPIGEKIVDNLPFVGTIDNANVTYRQQLALMSWQLIQQNPFFGSPYVLLYLESLRQGGGIIDLVNTYAAIAMYYGLVGLSLFLGFFLVGMWNAHRLVKLSAGPDPELSLLGVNLIACMSGTLVMMAIGSFGNGFERMFYVFAGLAAAYAQLELLSEPAPVRRTHEPRLRPRWTLKRS